MLLCLPLFLGFAAEAQAQAECVSNDLLAHVDARMQVASVDRWQRIKNALTEQPNPIALSEVKAIYQNRLSHGWNTNRLEDVITAMECLAKPKPGALEADDAPQSCVSPELQANVKGYSEETWHGSAHVERWLRVLQTFSGTANDSTVMTPAEAQEMANKYSANRWDPVVEALQCLETESLNAQIEVQEPESELDDTPLPLQAEETPMPQQADPTDTTSLRVYFHGGTQDNPHGGPLWTISEDDHWESELIIHFVTNQSSNLSTTRLCVNHDIWSGDDYWNNGPITLPGFDTSVDLKTGVPTTHELYGHWQCTDNVDVASQVTVLQDDADGKEFYYRATVRTRDNNVLEDDFSIADDLEFRFFGTYSGKTKYVPELKTDGSGDIKIPPTPSNDRGSLGAEDLPTIQDDEVSWIKLHKMNGKWTLSVYKPVMVTDGEECAAEEAVERAKHANDNRYKPIYPEHCDEWSLTDQGLVFEVKDRFTFNNAADTKRMFIPAINGIVKDIDYAFHDLRQITRNSNDSEHPSDGFVLGNTYIEACQQALGGGYTHTYVSADAYTHGVSSGGDNPKIAIDGPTEGSDLCR